MTSPRVLLVTSRDLADGEPGHEALTDALLHRGITSAWVVWDDPFVEWTRADLVAVRSTWDYSGRLADFLGWASSIGPTLLHGADVFRWNTDKSYLLDLAAAGLPVVPTALAADPVELRAAIGRSLPAVVKPRVGAGGVGIVLVHDSEAWLPVDEGPWVVQPLVSSVMDEGELSVFVMAGRPISQLRKVATPQDIRVHEEHGGTSYLTPLEPEAAVLAADAIAAATEILGTELVYGRVDMMRLEGRLVVSEVEVTEPGLYLDLMPENAEAFADVLAARL